LLNHLTVPVAILVFLFAAVWSSRTGGIEILEIDVSKRDQSGSGAGLRIDRPKYQRHPYNAGSRARQVRAWKTRAGFTTASKVLFVRPPGGGGVHPCKRSALKRERPGFRR